MQASAYAEDEIDLRARLTAYRADPDVQKFYQGLPVIAAGSRILVAFGIAAAAAAASAGVGSLATGAIGTTETLGGTLLAAGGTAALEAITFTAVTQVLQQTIPGQVTPSGGLADLAWNFGLFLPLRLLSVGLAGGARSMVRSGVPIPVARGMAGLGQAVVSFPLLHGYGLLRSRLSTGRWPTDAEMRTMTGENLLMFVGLTLGMSVFSRWLPQRSSPLQLFREQYGWRFASVDAGRETLLKDFTELLRAGNPTQPQVDALRARADRLELEFGKILAEAQADARIDLAAIRAALEKAGAPPVEGAAALLQREFGMPAEVGLRAAGGDTQYSYRWQATNRLEGHLRSLRATVTKQVDRATGLRLLTADLGGGTLVTFAERPQVGDIIIDPADPAVARLLSDFGLSDPAAQRYVLARLAEQMVQNPRLGVAEAARTFRKGVLNPLRDNVGKRGSTVQQALLDWRAKGELASTASPDLVAAADHLVSRGILDDDAWLSGRTDENLAGVVGERLAAQELGPIVGRLGLEQLRNVRLIGTQFTDSTLTAVHTRSNGAAAKNIELAEIDILVVRRSGAQVEFHAVDDVKTVRDPGTAVSEARAQTQQALELLRAHQKGVAIPVAADEGTVYAFVHTVEGIDPNGVQVKLTGQLYETPGGARTDVVVPRGSRRPGTTELSFTHREILRLIALLRERQTIRSGQY
jgi:hypothetical protein